MGDEKIIAVVGATGAQGGGLVRAILRGTGFIPRALTRNPGAAKARQLAEAGAEVVAADLDDAASVRRAFAGAFGAFCVTNYWEHYSPERELAQAGAMAAAARHAGVQHVVWSTLEDTRRWMPLDDNRMPTIKGKYKVPHFDGKGEANQLFIDAGVPTTFLLTSFYWDNLIHFGMGPRRGPDGRLAITFPMEDKKLPGIAVEDVGRSVYAIFGRGTEFRGRTVGIAGEHLTCSDMADRLGARPRRGGPLSRCVAGGVPHFRVSRRCRSREHVSVQVRLSSVVLRRARRGVVPPAEPIAADVRPVARTALRAHPNRLTDWSARPDYSAAPLEGKLNLIGWSIRERRTLLA